MSQPLPEPTRAVYPAGQRPVVAHQIGVTDRGDPVYAWRDPNPVQQPAPIVRRPWGLYLAGGTLGGFVLLLLIVGVAIALTVLAIAVVCLTTCTLILRSVWREYMREKTDN